VSRLLTQLTTLRSQLPQGAPTSTAIANLLLQVAVDQPLCLAAGHQNLRITRFVDDFAISGDDPAVLINVIAKMLSRRRLRIWRTAKKLKIMLRSQPQEITELNVNSIRGASVPRYKRDAIKAAIHQLRLLDEKKRPRAESSIRGRIAHVRQFNGGSAARLDKLLLRSLMSSNVPEAPFAKFGRMPSAE
jgi:hypothetical protein